MLAGVDGVAGLVLAAGAGRRMGGRPKALLPYRGGLLAEHAAGVLADGGCEPVVVVLGAAEAELRGPRVRVVRNPDWASGMGSSLRVGLAELPEDAAAVVVSLVDMPGVTGAAVRRLVRAFRGGSGLAAAAYGGRRGHPVLFAREHWAGIAGAARGDAGARAYLAARPAELTLVECGDVASGEDVDTPEAWQEWAD
jgi:nicotine blue oxidoreductase